MSISDEVKMEFFIEIETGADEEEFDLIPEVVSPPPIDQVIDTEVLYHPESPEDNSSSSVSSSSIPSSPSLIIPFLSSLTLENTQETVEADDPLNNTPDFDISPPSNNGNKYNLRSRQQISYFSSIITSSGSNFKSSSLKKPKKSSKNKRYFTLSQYEALFTTLEITLYPTKAQVLELSHITDLTATQIRNWFHHKRETLKRHNRLITQKRRISGSSLSSSLGTASHSSSLSSSTNATGHLLLSSSPSVDSDPDFPTRQIPSSRLAPPHVKLTAKEKRDSRLSFIKYVSIGTLEKCLENHKSRLSQLVLMYMKKKFDMRRTLLRETAELKQRFSINPFNQEQLDTMKLWTDEFFNDVGEDLDEEKWQNLCYIESHVVPHWQPAIIYGKLNQISLEVAIEDLSYLNQVTPVPEEFTVPGILRYMELHF